MTRLPQSGVTASDSAWRQGSSDFISAALFALGFALAPRLSDEWLLSLIAGAALQLLFVTHLVAGIVPRTLASGLALVVGHALLFALLYFVLSKNGERAVDLVPIALAQLPLLLRSLMQLTRPAHTDGYWMWEGLGAFLAAGLALGLAQALAWLLPETGLSARSIVIRDSAPIDAAHIELALLFGVMFFLLMGLGRIAAWHGRSFRRDEVDDSTIERWRREYEDSRRQR